MMTGQLSSPTSPAPKMCNLPSSIPLVPTPIEKNNMNKNESVTVTHFSDLHGGVVEKISVPVTSGSTTLASTASNEQKLDFTTTRTMSVSNNPFADEILTTKTIITTSTTTSPTIKISTNPFHSSFNATNERIDVAHSSPAEKSVKISFSILGTKNPFENDVESNGNNDSNNGIDIVDNDEKNLSSISSINLKIDNNNECNVTTIKMESPEKQHSNGTINMKKVIGLYPLFVDS